MSTCYRAHEVKSNYTSGDDVVDVGCPCEVLVEDDAEELDVIDLQDDMCRDVFASREEDGDCLVDGDLKDPFFEEFFRLR